jgi:hypothetical protein
MTGMGIAVIVDIARNRRNRKGKNLPLINTDDTDWKNLTTKATKERKEELKPSPTSHVIAGIGEQNL